jgi:uncharacterized protein (TIGR00369 family)
MSEALTAEQIQVFLDRSPFISFCGLKVTKADPATETVEMVAPFRPEFERGVNTKQWHGGPIAAVIDTAGDFALVMAIGKPLPTINFRVDYLRPAIDTALHAVAKVRRNGKSVGIVDVDIFNDKGILLAIGRATYATA